MLLLPFRFFFANDDTRSFYWLVVLDRFMDITPMKHTNDIGAHEQVRLKSWNRITSLFFSYFRYLFTREIPLDQIVKHGVMYP